MKGSLVSLDPKHLFKLDSTHSRGEVRHEKGRPEPSVERLLTPVHDCPSSEARIPLTVTAAVNGGAASEGIGRPYIAFVLFTVGTNKTIGKALCIEAGDAGLLVREVLLEVGHGFGETMVFARFWRRWHLSFA